MSVTISLSADRAYISSMIECPEGQERYVRSLYDSYLEILSNNGVGTGELRVHESQVDRNSEYTLSGWSFYLTPNELTGFGFAVPNELMEKRGEFWINTSDLVISSRETRQGHEDIILKEDEASNNPVQETPAKAVAPDL